MPPRLDWETIEARLDRARVTGDVELLEVGTDLMRIRRDLEFVRIASESGEMNESLQATYRSLQTYCEKVTSAWERAAARHLGH